MKHLKYTDKDSQGSILVHYTNGIYMGDMLIGDDGYYSWWPNENLGCGYIDAWVLRGIS